jgi:transposase
MYEYLLTLKVILRFPWRSTLGFAKGLIKRVYTKESPLPHYAHAAREANKLNLKIKNYFKEKKVNGMEIALDSTGVNVYTTSGYHQRKHGKENACRKRDQWKKIHFAIELNEQQILSMVYTQSNTNDCEAVAALNKNIKGKIRKVIADGAYDTEEVYQLMDKRGAQAVIPPAVTSKAQHELKKKTRYKDYLKQRDTTIKRIRKEADFRTGLKQWKKESGYHKRSLIETCMFRFKKLFGFYLQQKTENGRENEIIAKVNVLNRMSLLGLPQYTV